MEMKYFYEFMQSNNANANVNIISMLFFKYVIF